MALSVPDFSAARVLVAGDVMLDRYWGGPVDRISPEAPVPVVRIEHHEDRPGGAANVAINLAALGAHAAICGVVGQDDAAVALEKLLKRAGVDCHLVASSAAPTITKLRVMARQQQLIRLDSENDRATAPAAFFAIVVEALHDAGVLLLSDYGKGALTRVSDIIAAARSRGIPTLVDPKGKDFARYRGATILTPNQQEFETVVGACPDEATLVARAARLRRDLELDALLVTRSAKGMTLIDANDQPHHLAAAAREVFDVTGAGDTVIATLAASLAAGRSLPDAAALANLAASLVVAKVGVATVTRSELRMALHRRGIGGRGTLTEDNIVEFTAEAKARGETVVMTNGCFDLLHAGHVAYLEDAKALGDRLVVAVNDDASVTSLKGPDRPVTPLADRMAILAGLAAVDWVLPFSEATPLRLIERITPNVLVKGGDYQPDDIVGAGHVREHGGQVRVLPFREGRSTSQMIARIRGHVAP